MGHSNLKEHSSGHKLVSTLVQRWDIIFWFGYFKKYPVSEDVFLFNSIHFDNLNYILKDSCLFSNLTLLFFNYLC